MGELDLPIVTAPPESIWIWSDLHLSDRASLAAWSRPFRNADEMNHHLLREWSRQVRNRDTIICLGMNDRLSGAQHLGDQPGQVEAALTGGAYDAGQDLLGVGALAGAVAPAHFADDHRGPDGLFGPPVGGVDGSRRKRNTAGNSVARWLAKRWASGNPRRGVDESAEPGLEPAADRGEAVLAHLSGVAAVAGGEAGPQDRQDRRAPGTPGVAFPQFPAAVGEVIDAALVQPLVAAIHHPPVAPEHARVVGPEQGGGIVEAAAGADGVDGGLRGDARPQPVGLGADAPAGFVRRDHRRVADLAAEFPVGRPGVAGGPMQQPREAAGGDVHAEPGPQHVRDLCQRDPQLGVQLDGERDGPGAELHAGRAQSVGGLEAVAALHAAPTLRTVADLDVEAAYDGVHRREIFLILRGHAGHFDGAAAGGTRLGDAGRMGLVDPRRTPAASLPPVPCTGSSAWTPAAALPPVLGEGRGLSAAGPPPGSGIGISHRLCWPQTTHRVGAGAGTGAASGTGSLSDGRGAGEV